MRWPIRALPALAAGLALVGCGHSPPTQLFVLSVQPGAVRSAYAGPPIQVRAVHLPPQFDRPQIVTAEGSGRLKSHAFAHWAAPVGELSTAALTADLMRRLPKGKVISPETVAPGDAHLLSVDILDLVIAGGAATAEASWSVTTPGPTPRAPEVVTTHSAALSVGSGGSGPGADADALARLLGALADRIAESL